MPISRNNISKSIVTRTACVAIRAGTTVKCFSVFVQLPGLPQLIATDQENSSVHGEDFAQDFDVPQEPTVFELAQCQNGIDHGKENTEPSTVADNVSTKSKTHKPFHLKGRRPTKNDALGLNVHENAGDSRRFAFR